MVIGKNWRVFSIVLLIANTQVAAEVLDAGSGGFTSRHMVSISAPPSVVYTNLIANIGDWWSDDHTYSGNASNLNIDAKPLGCFCERLGDGSVVHLTVTFVDPNKTLRLSGGLGPLGLMGVSGSMTWELRDHGDKQTTVILTYAVGGYSADGLDAIAPAVDGVLDVQVARLKQWVETEQVD